MWCGVPASGTTSATSSPVGRRRRWWPASRRGGGPGGGVRPSAWSARWTVRRSPRSWPDEIRRTGVGSAGPGAIDRCPGSTWPSAPPSRSACSTCSPRPNSGPPPVPPTGRRWPMPWPTWSGTASGCVGCGRVRSTTWPPPGRWPPGSSTGPAAPSIPISIPTWWPPTSPRASTGPGRPSTVVGCSCTAGPPRPSTGPRCATTSPRRPAWPGTGGRRADGRSTGWTRCSVGCSPSGPRRSTSTPIGSGPRVRRGPAGPPSMPTGRTRSGVGTVDGLRSDWRRRAEDAGFAVSDLVRVVGHARALPGRPPVDPTALESGLEALVATRTRVSSRDLVAAVADAAPAGLGGAEAERRAAALGSGLRATRRAGVGGRPRRVGAVGRAPGATGPPRRRRARP